jgi:tRNA 2-thiouridine synthesizing protein E
MAYEIAGKTIPSTETGYLTSVDDWTEEVAKAIAATEGIEISDKGWDVINYLRDEYLNNNQNQPNERHMVKHFKEAWSDASVSQNTLYQIFPRGPAKQAGKIAGLPETKRKGGY